MESREIASKNDEKLDPEQRELLETLQRLTLGEYDVYCQIGSGGMASVYLGLELSLNRPVAIKVISPSTLTNKSLVDRFWLEARTAASLSHPHVIPIYAVRSIENLHFFVMKHVEGGSLDTLLKRDGKLSFALIRTILCQSAGALAYAHRHGVIHRDIKPGNIMLDDEGFAVVMDFGIAKVKDVDDLTASGMTVGTPHYMSPEQFSNRSLDGRADQYSLGVVAFELLAGRRPFLGDSMPQVLRGHLLDTAPDVRDFRPDCPAVVADAIKRMLAKTPEERFPTLDPFVSLLEGIPGIDQEQLRAHISSLARSMSLSQPRITMVASPFASRPVPVVKIADQVLKPSDKRAAPATRSWTKKRVLLLASLSIAVVVGGATLVAAMMKNPLPPAPSMVRNAAIAANTDSITRGAPSSSTNPSPSATEATFSAKKPTTLPNSESKTSAALKKPVEQAALTSKKEIPSMMQQKVDSGLPAAVTQSVIAPPPVAEKPVIFDGLVRIGSRVPRAGLYIDGSFAGLITGIRDFQHKPGQVRLQIKAEDCTSWDSVFYLGPGDTAKINVRNPRCSR